MPTSFMKAKNFVSVHIKTTLAIGGLSLVLETGEGATCPAVPFPLVIESEIVLVTVIVSDTLTITRAQESTSAAEHIAGTVCYADVTAKFITDLNSAVNTLEGYLPSGYINAAAGTVALPGIYMNGDVNTGLFQPAADQVGLAINGVQHAAFYFATIPMTIFSAAGANAWSHDMLFQKSRGANIVQDGDRLMEIVPQGWDGATWRSAGAIQAFVEGTPSAGTDMPGCLVFSTTPDGSATVAEVLRLGSTKLATFSGNVKLIAGTNSLPSLYWSTYNTTGLYSDAANTVKVAISGANLLGFSASAITLADAANVVLNTTTGTKIGTNVAQKLGFFNAAPIVQPAAADQAAAPAGGVGATAGAYDTAAHRDAAIATINAIRTALVNLGLMKGSA